MRQRAVLKRTLDVLGDASFSLTFVQLSPLVIVPFDMVSAPPPPFKWGDQIFGD